MRRGRALAVASLAALCVRCSTNEEAERPAVRVRTGLAWSAAAPTLAPHSEHTATLLGDGRVLVAGGAGAGDSAEIFDPRTASFSAASGKMHDKRVNHTATMLFSGKVLIVGGGDPAEKSAEIFDPATNAFTPTGSMSTARSGHAAVRLTSGRVLVTGGAGGTDASVETYDPSSGTFSASPPRTSTTGDGDLVLLSDSRALFLGQNGAEAFDLGTTTWSAVPNLMPTGYARSVTRVANGGVFVTWTSFPVGIPGQTFYQLFDPSMNAFGPSSAPISGASAAMSGVFMPNGRLLLVGGLLTSPSNTALVWDPTSDTFTPDDAMPTAHYAQTATMLGNGDVLVVGGAMAAADLRPWPGGVLPADASVALVEPRTGHVSARLHDGRVLLAGGDVHAPTGPFQRKASAEIFDPIARTSTATGSMTVARYRAAAIVLQSGKVLVCGGDDPSGMGDPFTPTADVFDPSTGMFHAVGSMS
ncbi:MAG TPA: kelch repeat-containing protein, partial [Labilithrix sp.]